MINLLLVVSKLRDRLINRQKVWLNHLQHQSDSRRLQGKQCNVQESKNRKHHQKTVHGNDSNHEMNGHLIHLTVGAMSENEIWFHKGQTFPSASVPIGDRRYPIHLVVFSSCKSLIGAVEVDAFRHLRKIHVQIDENVGVIVNPTGKNQAFILREPGTNLIQDILVRSGGSDFQCSSLTLKV